jgi:hypothetical protein
MMDVGLAKASNHAAAFGHAPELTGQTALARCVQLFVSRHEVGNGCLSDGLREGVTRQKET